MLKFLRKYQLILLAVGGSLLMVVFLLQPVLQQLTPDPRKEKVATIGDETILMGDQIVANSELEVLERFLPDMIAFLGLEDEENRTAHWILLKHEAERMGVMGVQTDGADWIQELALGLAQREIQLYRQFGQSLTPEQSQQILDRAYQSLLARKQALLRTNRGLDDAAFNRVLSKARGVMRLRRLYRSAPSLSRQRAVEAFLEGSTAILTDQLVLGPELLEGEVAEPTDDEVAAFFAEYRDNPEGNTDESAGGNAFGFGYLLPARVKLEWLALERSRIAEVVVPDPVAVRRRWQRENPDGGDFAADRATIEAEIREETVERILTDADEVIRGEILSATRGLTKEGIYRALPEGWTPPDLERIAQHVVGSIQERHGVRIPLPPVIRRTDAWQTPSDLNTLPGVGQATFRVGNQTIRIAELPSLVRGVGDDTRVAVQVGLPVIDPPAQGNDGSRYYLTVLEARGESPPDSVEEIRSRVVADIKSQRAFEMHTQQLDAYREAAVAEGLGAVAALYADRGGTTAPTVRDNILVWGQRVAPATPQSRPDPRASDQAFRDAVVDAGAVLDPLAEPDTVTGEESIVAVSLPASRSVAIARLRAKRPPAIGDFRLFQGNVVLSTVRDLVDAAAQGEDPLSFASLADRLDYESVRKRGENDEASG